MFLRFYTTFTKHFNYLMTITQCTSEKNIRALWACGVGLLAIRSMAIIMASNKLKNYVRFDLGKKFKKVSNIIF